MGAGAGVEAGAGLAATQAGGDSARAAYAANVNPSAASMVDPGSNWAAHTMTLFGGLTKAAAQNTAGNLKKKLAQDNARIALASARETEDAGTLEADRTLTRGRQAQGRQAVAQAANGVIIGAGTAGNAQSTTDQAANMDALMIQRNARRQALGLQTRAGIDEIEGDLAKEEGKTKTIATLLNTGEQEWLESDPKYGGFRRGGV